MVQKVYIKDESFDPIYKGVNRPFYFKSRLLPVSAILFGMGILITQIILPLVFFKTSDKISRPVSSTVLGMASGFRGFEFSELDVASPLAPAETGDPNIPKEFYLTVPRLRIEKAVVETNSPSLSPDYAIGHYKGSGLPNQPGNIFLYGHSVLPVFYNPKNYKAIFSTLNKLQSGDELTLDYNNKKYVYKVESMEILETEDVKPLQKVKPEYSNESTLTLMTCWPPGTKSKRLLIIATQSNPGF